jgi:restriction system protein
MIRKVKKVQKNFDKYIIASIFIVLYLIGIYDFIIANPSEIGAIFSMIAIPFFVGLTYKPFRKFVTDTLSVIIKSYRYKQALPIDLHEIDAMAGLEFEWFLKPVFERQGYRAEVTQGSGDYGADLVLRKGRKKYVVQAKRYSNNIGVGAIQQVVAAMPLYRAQSGIVVTNQYFTPAAVQLAEANGVRLIDREELAKMML